MSKKSVDVAPKSYLPVLYGSLIALIVVFLVWQFFRVQPLEEETFEGTSGKKELLPEKLVVGNASLFERDAEFKRLFAESMSQKAQLKSVVFESAAGMMAADAVQASGFNLPGGYKSPSLFVKGVTDFPVSTVVHDQVSCAFVSKENAKISLSKGDASEILVPDGFELASEPVSVACNGESLDMTLNVPQVFSDVNVVRCINGGCRPVSKVDSSVGELVCNGLPVRDFRKKQLESRPGALNEGAWGFKESTEVTLKPSEHTVVFGNYVIDFVGNRSSELVVSVSTPVRNVTNPLNPEFVMVGAPVILKVKSGSLRNVSVRVLAKFSLLENIDMKNLGLYRGAVNGWEFVPSYVVERLLLVGEISDFENVLDKNKEVLFAVMGRLCVACYAAKLERVYNGSSRNAIVLVHGLLSSPAAWQYVIDDYVLNKQPFQIWVLSYPMDHPSLSVGQQLADLLESRANEFDNVNLVGHSLGGFVVQHALKLSAERGFNFLKKVDKVVLIGSPNAGTPALAVLKDVIKYVINSGDKIGLLNLNDVVVNELRNGLEPEKLSGVSYVAIAGNKPYAFRLGPVSFSSDVIFGINEPNDGVTSVKSVQDIRVGPFFANESCKNLFLFPLTHTALTDDATARRVMSRIISSDVAVDNSLLGWNRFVRFKVAGCVSGESYVAVGKKVSGNVVETPLLCGCGNGVCGLDETRTTCSQDCKV
ncbi:alpha/beta hydrolase [Candidatus Woesearchaeota archaeon]|nr:alpha/beta hydrolase [Candidatus Woesearchaeota archaeon]